MTSSPFARVVAAVATPFKDDLTIDYGRFIAHAVWLLENGCDGLLLFGTTGEAASLSVAERMHALEEILAGGVPASRLMIGTGCCAIGDTVVLTKHADRAGCAGTLIVPPFYFKGVGDDGLRRYYDEIISASGAQAVYVYHIPQVSGVGVSPELVAALIAKHGDTIRGYKDSSGVWSNTATLLDRFPSLAVFVGTEHLLVDNLRAGGAGCITAGANVQPGRVRKVAERARCGGAEEAEAANAVRGALEKTGPLIPAVKAVLARIHGHDGWATPRPPLEALGAVKRESLFDALRVLSLESFS